MHVPAVVLIILVPLAVVGAVALVAMVKGLIDFNKEGM